MSNQGIDIEHPELRGEWAELRFMARAAEHGLRVSKPWGDCASYDVSVEHDGKFLRVQVKSTKSSKKGSHSYICDLRRRGSQPYTQDRVDFFAIYVIPCDLWYILPAAVAIGSQANLTLSPDLPDSKHAPYKEAWHLLSGKTPAQEIVPVPASPEDEHKDDQPDAEPDEPVSLVEARLRAVRARLMSSPCWKPRP